MAEPLQFDITANINKLATSLAAAEARVNRAAGRIDADARRMSGRVTTGLNSASAGFTRMGASAGAQRFVIQNTANQLGDLAVQIGSGTSAARALGQQLPQLFGGFGALGGTLGLVAPLLGTIAAIGIPIGVALLAMGDGAEDAATKLDKIKALDLGQARSEIKQLTELQDQLSAAVVAYGRNQSDTTASNLINIAKEYEAKKALLELEAIQTENRLVALRAKQAQQAEEIRGILEDARREAEAFNQAIVGDPEGQRRGNEAVARAILAAADANAELVGGLKQTTAEVSLAEITVDSLRKTLSEAVGVALEIAGTDLSPGINAGVAAADALVGRLTDALGVQRQIATEAELVDAQNKAAFIGDTDRGGQRDARRSAAEFNTTERLKELGLAGGRRGRSGGGGGTNPLIAQIEALETSLLGQEEAALRSFQRQQEQLDLALQQKLITQEKYNALTEAAQKKHQDQMVQIDVYRYGTTLDKTGAFLGSMSQALANGNEEMLKISKAFGAAQALISAWQGAAEALKLPFPANLAAFAQVLATGFGAVSAIQGVGKGGTGGSAAAAPVAAPQSAGTYYNVNLTGERFDQSAVRGLLSQFNEALRNGGRISGIKVT